MNNQNLMIDYELMNAKGEFYSNGTKSIHYIPTPDVFSVSAAYPNPFNPSTTIEFTLPQDSPVALEVYNFKGQLVTTLIDQKIHAGYHHIVWDAKDLGSGIYFIKLVAGDQHIDYQKVILLK